MARRAWFVVVAVVVSQLGWAAPAARAGGGGCYTPVTNEASTRIVMHLFSCFSPTVTRIDVGDEVTWVNQSPEQHNVVSSNGHWYTNTMNRKGYATFLFTEEGTFPYYCQFHMGMIGTVVVGGGIGDGAVGHKRTLARAIAFDPGIEPKKHKKSKGSGDESKKNDVDEGAAPGDDDDLLDSKSTSAETREPALPIEWLLVVLAAIIVPGGVMIGGLMLRKRSTTASETRMP